MSACKSAIDRGFTVGYGGEGREIEANVNRDHGRSITQAAIAKARRELTARGREQTRD